MIRARDRYVTVLDGTLYELSDTIIGMILSASSRLHLSMLVLFSSAQLNSLVDSSWRLTQIGPS